MKALLRGILFLSCAMTSAFSDAPFVDLKFDDACKKASQEHKIVLIDFYTMWCVSCKELDRETWPDADVKKLLGDKTVPLKIDAEKEDKLADRYSVVTYPCVLLLKPDGTEIDRLVGTREPKDFISDFNLSISGQDTETRAREAVAKAGGKDPELRLNLGELLRQKGSNAGALKEFLWCYNHGLEIDPSFAWDRAGYLLNSLEILSETYPPAQQARETLRDEKEKAMLSGTGDRQTAADLISLNDDQGHGEKSLAIFDKLPVKSRGLMAIEMVDKLAEAKRYNDILGNLGNSNPKAIFTRDAEKAKPELASMAGNPDKKDVVRALMDRTISTGAGYFEALAATGKNDEALSLAGQILQFNNSGQTKAHLIKSAEHAGNTAVTDKLKSGEAL
jgi:thioredoxin-related protein